MALLTAQYIPGYDIYMVIPVIGRKEDPETEYVFPDEASQREFIQAYYRNPVAASYAYQMTGGV